MGRLVLFDEITLDGNFQGLKDWDLDFLQPPDRDIGPYTDQLNRDSGALLLGRVTYEGLAAAFQSKRGKTASILRALPKFVFSRTLPRPSWDNTTVVRSSPAVAVRRLKRESSKVLQLVGSAALASTLRRAGLIDEYRLWLNPTILGRGKPLFASSEVASSLRFVEVRPMPSGRVLLRLEPRRSNKPAAHGEK